MIESIILVVIFAFGAYTYRVGKEVGGYLPFWRNILSKGPSRQVTIDLYISTTILCVFMVLDAPKVGISLVWVFLYVVVAVFMGSFGPLLYLLHRVVVT